MKVQKTFIKKCLAAAVSGVMLTSVCAVNTGSVTVNAAENLISNSTFENGTSGWALYKESGGAATLGTENGRLAVNITSLGTVNYAVQPNFDVIPLYKNGVYRLKFDVSCTVDRFIEGMIQQNGGTYTAYTWKGIDLTSEMQTIDYEFVMEYDTDIMTKLCFNCGIQEDHEGQLPPHTIYFDNVSLELVDDSKVDYSADKPYEPDIVTNQVGYRTDDVKTAVFRNISGSGTFNVVNVDTKENVYTGKMSEAINYSLADETDYTGDFSAVIEPGTYYITADGADDSYTFTIGENVYKELIDDSVRMLYLQRCGCEVIDDEFGHPACHNTMATIYQTDQKIDVSGGWHDAGDYGRYIVPAAKAVADLLYAYDAAPELYGDDLRIPESGNGIPDVLDEVRYELEWMLKMQSENGGVYHKVSCDTFPGYVMPQAETKPLIVTPVSSTATADFCASMALAYEMYLPVDAEFAWECFTAAEKSWEWLEKNPDFLFKNPTDIVTGDYGDRSDSDERYWAAAQMYRATGDGKYLDFISSAFKGLDWSTVGDYGNIAILTSSLADKDSEEYKNAMNAVISQANNFKAVSNSSPYGVSLMKFAWGSNMTVANAGVICGLAYRLTGDEAYLEAANSNLDYLLGYNPNAVCFVTGYGTVSPASPHHRPSMAVGKAMKGMLVGGVNSALEDPAAKAYLKNAPSAKCYVDNSESYSTNEITIYWNSPLTYLFSLTEKNETSVPAKDGDINNDGYVNMADLVYLQKYLLRKETMTLEQAAAADVCKDNEIDVFDLVKLRQLIIENK